jgi:hypothetical protein
METKNPNKARAKLNMFLRYRAKNDAALKNYFRHAASNWKRSDYWLRVAGRWAARARSQFPSFCGSVSDVVTPRRPRQTEDDYKLRAAQTARAYYASSPAAASTCQGLV